jgi:hypothetical protein
VFSERDLLSASDEMIAADSPMDDEVGLTQCWIGEESGLRIAIGNYQMGSLTGQVRGMNWQEIGEILEAMAGCLAN